MPARMDGGYINEGESCCCVLVSFVAVIMHLAGSGELRHEPHRRAAR